MAESISPEPLQPIEQTPSIVKKPDRKRPARKARKRIEGERPLPGFGPSPVEETKPQSASSSDTQSEAPARAYKLGETISQTIINGRIVRGPLTREINADRNGFDYFITDKDGNNVKLTARDEIKNAEVMLYNNNKIIDKRPSE